MHFCFVDVDDLVDLFMGCDEDADLHVVQFFIIFFMIRILFIFSFGLFLDNGHVFGQRAVKGLLDDAMF